MNLFIFFLSFLFYVLIFFNLPYPYFSLPLFSHLGYNSYHFSLFPSHFLCSFFMFIAYIFYSFFLSYVLFHDFFICLLFEDSDPLQCDTVPLVSGSRHLLNPNALNQSPQHNVATINASHLCNTKLRTSVRSLCFNSCFFFVLLYYFLSESNICSERLMKRSTRAVF